MSPGEVVVEGVVVEQPAEPTAGEVLGISKRSGVKYVGREGIVVDSTANAWRIALPKPMVEKKAKRGKEKEAGAGDEEETTDGAPNKSNEEEDATTVSVVWKETVVPKSRSSLSFAIDTVGDTSNVPGKDLRVIIGQM